MEPRALRIALRAWVALVLLFLFVPIVLIVLYAFNRSNIESWPISGFSTHWFAVAARDAQVRSAFWLSVRVGLVATGLALALGSAVAYALSKFAFFGREAISLLLVLPLALPGIVTGIALNSFFSFTGIQLGTLTIVVGHTTFCIVVVFNNLVARLRRTPGSLAEASMDLGARGWQTLLYVTLPMTATALVSGALLAFGLSFDEVIVTVFTAGAQNTLPLWIFGAIRLGQQLPEVNAVVSVVILLTVVPVVLAARLAGAGSVTRSARNVPVGELPAALPAAPFAGRPAGYPARFSRTWRLIRPSIAAMPRSRSGLTRSFSPSIPENSAGVPRTSSAPSPSRPACRIEAKPRVVGASGGASKNRRTVWSGSSSTARNSGDWHSGTGSSRSCCPA
jgi:putative spermidine/putrescine transport system permease protein